MRGSRVTTVVRVTAVTLFAIVALLCVAYAGWAGWIALDLEGDPRSELPPGLFWAFAGGALAIGLVFAAAAFLAGTRRHAPHAWWVLAATALLANAAPFTRFFGAAGYGVHAGLLGLATVSVAAAFLVRHRNGDAHA